ncbi:hypothetical protein [Paraburkholderia graminis]|uniref:hypothetical protein n=1 Tax=Paraburkholderia graminis TaxID=60548 RepID=UPI00137A9A07
MSRAVSVETRKGKLHRAASICEQTKMMALRDRLHAIQFGIAAGVPAHEHDGETLLYAIDVPYEFRDCKQQSCIKAQNWTSGRLIRRTVSCVVRRRFSGWHTRGMGGRGVDRCHE